MGCEGRAVKKPRTKLAEYARLFASRGGTPRAKALAAKERTAIDMKGAEARWGRTAPKKPGK